MKNIKKFLSCFFVVMIIMIFNNEDVFAKDKKWPQYSETITNQLHTNYCSYNIGSGGKYYSNGTIYITYIDGKLYYIHPETGSKLDLEFGSAWDTKGFNQYVYAYVYLTEYLVSNGKLNCKQLYFFENSGDLNISTPDGVPSDVTNSSTGLLEYKGMNVGKCEDYKKQITNLYTQWNNNTAKNQAVSFISNLKNVDSYHSGMLRAASNQNAVFDAEYNKLFPKVQELLQSDIDLVKCQEYNNSKTELNRLQQSLSSDLQNVKIGFANVKSNYDKAVTDATANGDTEMLTLLAQESDIAQQALDSLEEKLKDLKTYFETYLTKFDFGTPITDDDCEGLLGPDLLDDISTVMTWIRIAVPILLIILGTVDFAKAVISDDQQEYKKSTGRFVKRCLIAIAIFFIPSLIMYLLSFIDKIADVSCDIRLW